MKWLCCLSLLAFVAAQPDFDWDTVTALDEYVQRPDDAFSWNVVDKYELRNVDVYMVNMTSQNWMATHEGDDFATRQLWWHFMGICVPHEIRAEQHAALYITGGSNRNPDDVPDALDLYNVICAKTANDTGVIAAYIRQVPNQPIVFRDDPQQRSRSEDDIIAYTWRWYIDRRADPDAEVPEEVILRMPMTKAGKAAMDTMQEFAVEVAGYESEPTDFIVMGASKRGWTTWSLAATDQRVKICVPLVMSLLNFEETLQSHFKAFEGGWSFAFRPYWRENLTLHFDDPIATDDLYDYEDMFRYRSRLAQIPKLAISATGDEFFLNQDYHHWWEEMGGPKWIQMCPNAEHALFPHWLRIYSTVLGFYTNWMEGVPMPEVSWTRSTDAESRTGNILLQTNYPPLEVRGMNSVTLPNNTRRDWRLQGGYDPVQVQPIWWFQGEVDNVSSTEFSYTETEIDDEWVGFMVETKFESAEGYDMYLTSDVEIIPATFPVEEDCSGDGCYGYLT